MLSISVENARKLFVAKQCLAGSRREGSAENILHTFRQLGCIQIDPIRAVERTQYLVLWSRLGNYERDDFHNHLYTDRNLFEYWAHAASIVLTENYQLHQMQMRTPSTSGSKWAQRFRAWVADNEAFRDYVLDECHTRGPLELKQLEDRSVTAWKSGGWSTNRNVGMMVDHLWTRGHLMVANRNGLRRFWDVTEKVLPAWTPTEPLSEAEIVRRSAQISLRALGVGTLKHIKNHFMRGWYPDLEQVMAQLVDEGVVRPITTPWGDDWFIHSDDVPLLRQIEAGEWQPRTILLSPFDNLICDRDRTELMWDFHFRIEIYVPKAKRQYGYYVLPILHGERLIGRIAPKMDRKKHILNINGIYAEPDAPRDEATTQAIRNTIDELAVFLGAKKIVVNREKPVDWEIG